jgi:hypothetical protein
MPHAFPDFQAWPRGNFPVPHEASKGRRLFARIPGGGAIHVGRWRRLQTPAGPGLARQLIEGGLKELNDQHASEREVEAWDMSCRIAFLLEIAPRR